MRYCGDWFLTVALLDLVLELTGSAALSAVMLVCQTLPAFLLAPIAGTVVDRVDRRKLMIAVSLPCTVFALLPLLARTPELLPLAFVGVAGISSMTAFFQPAANSALPNVVRRDDLAPANVLFGSVWGVMLAVGAALGGVAAATLGRNACFLIDSLAYLTATGLLLTVRGSFQARSGIQHPGFLRSLKEAASYAGQHRRVLALLTAKGGFGLSGGVFVFLSVFAVSVFEKGAVGIGLLFCARGVGALIGPFVVERSTRSDLKRFSLIGIGAIIMGAGYSLFAISPVFILAAFFVFVAHLGGGSLWTLSSYGLQRLSPDALRGRLFAADFGMYTLASSVSILAAGLLAGVFGSRQTALLLGLLALGWGVVWTVWTRPFWREQPSDAPSVAAQTAAVDATAPGN